MRVVRTRRPVRQREPEPPALEPTAIDVKAFDPILGHENVRRVSSKKVTPPSPELTARRMMELLVTILELRSKRPPRDVTLVFDIDNTLVDTRPRTLAAAATFTSDAGGKRTSPLAHATVEDMGYLPADTCKRLGVTDESVQRAFAEHFEAVFWDPKSFHLDQAIRMPVALAKLAMALGAQVHFLTGRTETYRDETIAKLRELGLEPASAKHLIMKPAKRDRHGRFEKTERFKARELRKLHRRKIAVAGFVSEGARDVSYLQKRVKEVMRFLFLQFPIDEPGYTVGRTRTIWVAMEHALPSEDAVRAAWTARQKAGRSHRAALQRSITRR